MERVLQRFEEVDEVEQDTKLKLEWLEEMDDLKCTQNDIKCIPNNLFISHTRRILNILITFIAAQIYMIHTHGKNENGSILKSPSKNHPFSEQNQILDQHDKRTSGNSVLHFDDDNDGPWIQLLIQKE